MPGLPEIYDKVTGLRFELKDEVTVWFAESGDPGKGNFSKYVDERMAQHPKTTTVRAKLVLNPIVRGMLLRRGFVEEGMDLVRPGVPDDVEA